LADYCTVAVAERYIIFDTQLNTSNKANVTLRLSQYENSVVYVML